MSQDDDSPEIEMTADEPTPAPAVPPVRKHPRRRTPNPVVDEAIHTGEIAPRSTIVRATPSMEMPKIEISDEKTELSAPPVMAPPAAAAPRLHDRAITAGVRKRSAVPVVVGLGLAVAGIVIAVVVVTKSKSAPATATTTTTSRPDEGHRLALQAAAQFIGTTLDADSKAALMRAEAMASSSMLRAGILTDASTLQDMAKDKDVVFKLEPGESLEVIQVHSGTRTSLLHLPADSASVSAPPIGKTAVVLRDGVPFVVANAEIADQQGTSGEVVLASPIDLGAMKKRVEGHAVEATLSGLDVPVVLAKSAQPAGEKIKLLIDNEAKLPLALEVALPK